NFGLSVQLGPERLVASGRIGTPFYIAPEAHFEHKYGTKVEIWALNVTTAELYSRSEDADLRAAIIEARIRRGTPLRVLKERLPLLVDFGQFLIRCTACVPDQLATAADLLRVSLQLPQPD
ncbi:Serine/threonine-protein kinase PAK 3, partial [Tilletia horrida]